MEELQTTEALDREILEDARKKAFKILKGADDSLSSSKASWDRKLEKTKEKVRSSYTEKEEQMRREIMARLPMDKRRIRSETIDHFLGEAIAEFLGSLNRTSLLYILEKELEMRKTEISGVVERDGKGEIRYRSLSKEECVVLVSASFPDMSFSYSEDPLYMIAGSFPALMIDFSHIRLTVSADKSALELLLEKRAELTAALLGDIEDLTLGGGGNG